MLKKFVATLATAVLALGMGAAAQAQKVVYYDHSQVIADSKAWKAVQGQLETKGNEIQAQLEPIASEINTEGEAIQKLTKGMNQEDAAKKHGERIGQFQQKVVQLQRTEKRVNQEFQLIRELAEGKINVALAKVMPDVAKKQKADVVMRKTSFSYYDPKVDVTQDVLAALDKELTTINIDSMVKEVQERQQQLAEAQQQ